MLAVGNPPCLVLGPLSYDARFARLGPALVLHPTFPYRTNVEFAWVRGADNRGDELGCRNPEFHEVPRARPSFRIFAQITPNA